MRICTFFLLENPTVPAGSRTHTSCPSPLWPRVIGAGDAISAAGDAISAGGVAISPLWPREIGGRRAALLAALQRLSMPA